MISDIPETNDDLADEVAEHPVRHRLGPQQRAVLALDDERCGDADQSRRRLPHAEHARHRRRPEREVRAGHRHPAHEEHDDQEDHRREQVVPQVLRRW